MTGAHASVADGTHPTGMYSCSRCFPFLSATNVKHRFYIRLRI